MNNIYVSLCVEMASWGGQEGRAAAWKRTPTAWHLMRAGPPGPARLPRGTSPFPAAAKFPRRQVRLTDNDLYWYTIL
jgi:hypothetical protein